MPIPILERFHYECLEDEGTAKPELRLSWGPKWFSTMTVAYQSADPRDDSRPLDKGHRILGPPGLAPSKGTPETPAGVHARERKPL